jgi:hypothetical protein
MPFKDMTSKKQRPLILPRIILTWQRKSGLLKIIQRPVVILTYRIWAKYDMLQHSV